MMKKRTTNKLLIKQGGFTIIELMIATMVFMVILLLCSFALLQIGKSYTKGVNNSSTQDVARSIVDEVGQAIQFNSGNVVAPTQPSAGGAYYFNVGDKCYSFVLGQQLVTGTPGANQSNDVFTRANGACSAPTDWSTPGGFTELMGQRMRVAAFYLCTPGHQADNNCLIPTPGDSTLYSVGIRVVYGDDDLLCSPLNNDCDTPGTVSNSDFTAPDLSCKTQIGSQYCAVSQISTTVQKRKK